MAARTEPSKSPVSLKPEKIGTTESKFTFIHFQLLVAAEKTTARPRTRSRVLPIITIGRCQNALAATFVNGTGIWCYDGKRVSPSGDFFPKYRPAGTVGGSFMGRRFTVISEG